MDAVKIKEEITVDETFTVPSAYEIKNEFSDTGQQVNTNYDCRYHMKSEIPYIQYGSGDNIYKLEPINEELNIKNEDDRIVTDPCSPEAQNFTSGTCDYQSINHNHLYQHIQTGSKEMMNILNGNIKQQVKSKGKLKLSQYHILKCAGKKPFKCNVCNYSSASKSNLKSHIRTHTNEKSLKCNVCNYKCSQNRCLKSHLDTHTVENPLKCSMCEYECSQKTTLKKHFLIHTNAKRFKCAVCEYECFQKCELQRHVLTHTPFKCVVCLYKCSDEIKLKAHLQTHTVEKHFECAVCDYKCSKESTLEKHTEIHTGIHIIRSRRIKPFDYNVLEEHSYFEA